MSEQPDARAILQQELDDLQRTPVPQVYGRGYWDKFTRAQNDQARAVHAARILEVERLLAQLGGDSIVAEDKADDGFEAFEVGL